MSRTYSIACRDCREHLWIGQSSEQGAAIYSGDPQVMTALRNFLFSHAGHALVFGENCESEIGDFKEIKPAKFETTPSRPPR